jgi:hypothetical protein
VPDGLDAMKIPWSHTSTNAKKWRDVKRRHATTKGRKCGCQASKTHPTWAVNGVVFGPLCGLYNFTILDGLGQVNRVFHYFTATHYIYILYYIHFVYFIIFLLI